MVQNLSGFQMFLYFLIKLRISLAGYTVAYVATDWMAHWNPLSKFHRCVFSAVFWPRTAESHCPFQYWSTVVGWSTDLSALIDYQEKGSTQRHVTYSYRKTSQKMLVALQVALAPRNWCSGDETVMCESWKRFISQFYAVSCPRYTSKKKTISSCFNIFPHILEMGFHFSGAVSQKFLGITWDHRGEHHPRSNPRQKRQVSDFISRFLVFLMGENMADDFFRTPWWFVFEDQMFSRLRTIWKSSKSKKNQAFSNHGGPWLVTFWIFRGGWASVPFFVRGDHSPIDRVKIKIFHKCIIIGYVMYVYIYIYTWNDTYSY